MLHITIKINNKPTDLQSTEVDLCNYSMSQRNQWGIISDIHREL